mgnify:CR=1 FL=1
MIIRQAMLYETECWATKKHVDKMSVVEMRMLRWMCGKPRKSRVRNEYIREWVGVVLIEDKLRENKLRRLSHIQWRPIEAVVKKGDIVIVDGSVRGRGRPSTSIYRYSIVSLHYCLCWSPLNMTKPSQSILSQLIFYRYYSYPFPNTLIPNSVLSKLATHPP